MAGSAETALFHWHHRPGFLFRFIRIHPEPTIPYRRKCTRKKIYCIWISSKTNRTYLALVYIVVSDGFMLQVLSPHNFANRRFNSLAEFLSQF